jgi:hypothetical protein
MVVSTWLEIYSSFVIQMTGNLSWRGCRQSAQEAMESRKTPSESSLPTMGLYFVVYQLEATHRGHYAFRLLLSHVIRTTLFSVRWHRSLSIFLYQRPVAGFMVPCVQDMWIALRDTGRGCNEKNPCISFNTLKWNSEVLHPSKICIVANISTCVFKFFYVIPFSKLLWQYLTLPWWTWLNKLADCCAFSFICFYPHPWNLFLSLHWQ